MKRVFEKPVMNVELFVANQAVSSCTVHGQGVSYKFDCMYGPKVDTANVIGDIPGVTANCKLSIGYTESTTTARDYCKSNQNHSNNNSSRAEWEEWTNAHPYRQVTYSGAAGILFTDGNESTDAQVWSIENGYVMHSSASGGMHHMVAPVINPNNMDSSW